MRKELFNAIKTKLANDVPEVKHIDLWNHNVEFIEQEDGWERPAVFVEFATIEWAPFQGGMQRGKGNVSIHIVTDWTEGEYDAAFDISRKYTPHLTDYAEKISTVWHWLLPIPIITTRKFWRA